MAAYKKGSRMTTGEIIEKARNKFPTAKNIRLVMTVRWPERASGPTAVEIYIVRDGYTTIVQAADTLTHLAVMIDQYREPEQK